MPPMFRLIQPILDLVFPPTCLGCGRDAAWLCQTCITGLPGLTIDRPTSEIDRLACLGSYDLPLLQTGIQRLKYSGARVVAEPLAIELGRRYDSLMQGTPIIPVPLHPSRRHRRGFNQAQLLAESLSRSINGHCRAWVRRTKRTVSQVELNEHQRQINVHDAFALVPGLERVPPHGIIVDDVFTTGATISAVARVLRSAGMKHITAVTVAKG